MSTKELRTEWATCMVEARLLCKPEMTAEETQRFDRLLARAGVLADQIKSLEKRAKEKRQYEGKHLQPANLVEIKLPPEAAKLLREGNSVRMAVAQVGDDKVLEIVFSPIWNPGISYGEKPKEFEVEDVEFSTYGEDDKTVLFRGHHFPIVLK